MGLKVKRAKKFACTNCGRPLKSTGLMPLTIARCPSCKHRVVVPGRFGDFLLYGVLGKGAMGMVYKALNEKVRRYVALKVLTEDHKKADLDECLKEAQAMAVLNHSNIVRVYNFGQAYSQYYIEMELLEGGSTKHHFGSQEVPREIEILKMGLGVVDGLAAAHKASLLHMDVKPTNVLFDTQLVPKLVDFGFAQHVRTSMDFVGTPNYVAPEVAKNMRYDHRADIYSLGATLFRLLTKRPVFRGGPKQVIKLRIQQPAPPLRDVRGDLTDTTCRMVDRMLTRNPKDRFQTYEELKAEMVSAHRVAGSDDMLDELADLVE
jgi:serine/threonine protein kinase